MKNKVVKFIINFVKWVFISLILILILAYLTLRLSSVQTYLANKAAAFLSEKTGVEVRIKSVDISNFVKISLKEISLKDNHDSIFLTAKSIDIKIKPFKLLQDTVYVKNIKVDSAFVSLIQYKNEDDINIMQLVNYFNSNQSTDTSSTPFGITVKNVEVSNTFFALDLQNTTHYEGMDYTHLIVNNVNIKVNDFKIKNDTLIGNIKQFSAEEKCGFKLDSLKGETMVSPRELVINNMFLKANNSYAYANLRLEYNEWYDWMDFINKVNFNSKIDSSKILLSDIKYFAGEMNGLDNYVCASGLIKGNISNLKISDANLSYGKNTFFKGYCGLLGLPNIEQTFMRIKIDKATINNHDLKEFKISKNEKINISDQLNKLGNISIKGRFTGFYNDFVSDAKFNTALGDFSTDISLQPDKNNTIITYNGQLNATHFNLGSFFGTSKLGFLTMQANMKGKGLSSSLTADYDLKFNSIDIDGITYEKLNVIGDVANKKITAEFNSIDGLFLVKAKGFFDFSDSLPNLFMSMKVHNAKVNRLLFIPKDTLGTISTNILIDLKGNDISNISGYFIADSVNYNNNNKKYSADKISITSTIDNENLNQIEVRSPFIDANIDGLSNFGALPEIYKTLLNNVLPNVINQDLTTNEYKFNKEDKLNLNIDFKNTAALSEIFYPILKIEKGTSLTANYDYYSDNLKFKLISPSIKYNKIEAKNINLNLDKENSQINYNLEASSFNFIENIPFDSLTLQGKIKSDSLYFNVDWGKIYNKLENNGAISGNFIFNNDSSINLNLFNGSIYLNDSLWLLQNEAKLKYSNHYLKVENLNLASKENSMFINGQASDNPLDFINIKLDRFNVSLIDYYTKEYDTDLDGFITGNFTIANIWKTPAFKGYFSISDFYLNKVFLNSLNMNTEYSKTKKAIVFDANINSENELKYLDIEGLFFPQKITNNLNANIIVKDFPLEAAKNYLSSFSSSVAGTGNGNLKLTGTILKPVFEGVIKTNVSDIKIDYTNTHYKINDNLIFKPNYFGYENAIATDKKNNKLTVTALLKHNFFQDFNLDIDVRPNKAELINTTSDDNELFYGSANGSGRFQMSGTFNDLKLKLNISPSGESYIAIPISSQLNAEESGFLQFITKDSTKINNSNLSQNQNTDLSIDMNMMVNVTPSTKVELVMDKKVGDVITAQGNGNMKITYDKNGNLNVYGNYIIEKGNYLFTIQSIINKRFTISSGSSIVWDGDMENAKLDIKAVYHTEAKLENLVSQINSSQAYKKPSKVNCIINIKGTLEMPIVTFDVALPDESFATRELVNSIISVEATGNSEELNKNFVSLLVFNCFQPPNGYSSLGSNPIGNNATEMVAEQVGNILNQLTDKVDVGLEWTPGDNVTTREVAVALSYSMLNDRLVIDGKFGTGGGSTDANANTRIVGDISAGYSLTKDGRITAKVFNRTNYYDPISRKEPYTQGIGISYKKDFNNIKELIIPKNKKKSKTKKVKEL